jgi:hypothetical protein
MLARPAASAIAAASLKSFLLLFRYGFTNCAGRIRTSWPASVNTRPQYCAPGHDSVATMHLGAVAANWASCELAEDGRARVIQADQMEPVFPEINADNRWLRHVPLLLKGRAPFSKRRGRPFHYAALTTNPKREDYSPLGDYTGMMVRG